ncbi:DUF5986 family protein [Brevibacillus porteri]|uniref:Uncharacterized protein n=1 Tax=Brevibacillus porteri TaxID=2126350 RepID=A0ABX5FJI3_9BACL|nr:DUF5986 family protein [Brevibacillus porteri]MED1802995.1 DUF5986 family protein [Brevibacillus porteri]MED2134645.1 DUF5986 family protein [Brevibacillus porteri]MED2748176.1 DUF5986 family protein [Brevibacillus porteri]MED2817499.1 DUF5986 family protein [Brevibacillus porteri]MED2897807.1 DUF5986 family protein [Brevibacillus porteri]
MQLNIPLFDKIKAMIVEGIVRGNDDDYREFVENKKTETNNGNVFCRMDYINTKLIEHLPVDDFAIEKVKRGRFEHIQIYEKQSGNLYVVMAETRFQAVRDSVSLESLHYIEAYAIDNGHLSKSVSWDERPGQLGYDLEMPENHQVNAKYLDLVELSRKMIGDKKINMCTIITFSLDRNQKVKEVFARVPDIDLERPFLCEEDWSKWIVVDYSSFFDQEAESAPSDSDEIPLEFNQSVKDMLNNNEQLGFKQQDEKEEDN